MAETCQTFIQYHALKSLSFRFWLSISAYILVYYVYFVHCLPYDNYSNVIELDQRTFEKEVLGSSENWLVEFYAPWCGYCKQLEPVYKKVASRLKDAVRVGAVNAEKYPNLSQRYQVRGFPTIFLFRLSNKKNKIPVEYQGDRTSKSLLSFVEERIPSFVAQVKSAGIEPFLRNEPELPHVLLATMRKAPSVLLKALSSTYAESIIFGIIHKDDIDSELMKLYGIEKYPVLLGFQPNSKATSLPDTFHLEHMQRKDIHGFLKQVLSKAKLNSSATSSDDMKNVSNKFGVDNWNKIVSDCLAHKEKICILFIFCANDEFALLFWKNLTSRYRDSIFQFSSITWEHCPKRWLEEFGTDSSVCFNSTLVAWKMRCVILLLLNVLSL
ncbi:protein disulfide-isomerase [Galdieria sulphuraria]|uniref:Protein disulfide-isomerase n=1 Tax=Galdieria sulphuraria TaxID=130081 RepID=M2XFX7_GALSU|nr:protein disulfide-isomerase [Galdieria sulphuraria]EME28932.1 protein disulfide-isomerase [Galdieria sulphuraria]|eukprot:XP_005705452.1 protein disulfide-isomerase [Galdieria sulphuraria]